MIIVLLQMFVSVDNTELVWNIPNFYSYEPILGTLWVSE